jgi:membrane associated rhomboid family serine protease
MVVVFWAESIFHIKLTQYGIYPRRLDGLKGILFSPFIHGSIKHLFNNLVPFFVLTTALFYFYRTIKWKVLLWGTLLTGISTWLIGRPSWHIGASGIIYLLTSFLLFKGIFSRQYQLTALSFIVIFLYGGFIWYVFPIDPKISWEGHLSGFFVGFIFALIFNEKSLKPKKYDWEQEDFNPDEDPFIKQFDEKGNFIERPKEEPNLEDEILEKKETYSEPKIVYTFKKNNASQADKDN